MLLRTSWSVYTQFVVHILHMCGQLVVWAAAFGTTSALGATSGKAHVRNTPAAAGILLRLLHLDQSWEPPY